MKLPALKPREIIKFLAKEGFVEIRSKGSHRFFQSPDGKTTVVPFHKGRDIAKGTLRAILNDIDLSPEEFLKKLRKKH